MPESNRNAETFQKISELKSCSSAFLSFLTKFANNILILYFFLVQMILVPAKKECIWPDNIVTKNARQSDIFKIFQ